MANHYYPYSPTPKRRTIDYEIALGTRAFMIACGIDPDMVKRVLIDEDEIEFVVYRSNDSDATETITLTSPV